MLSSIRRKELAGSDELSGDEIDAYAIRIEAAVRRALSGKLAAMTKDLYTMQERELSLMEDFELHDRMVELDAENAKLKEEVARLTAQNEGLQRGVDTDYEQLYHEAMSSKGMILFGKTRDMTTILPATASDGVELWATLVTGEGVPNVPPDKRR